MSPGTLDIIFVTVALMGALASARYYVAAILNRDRLEECDPALEGDLDALGMRLEEVDIMPELLTRIERQTTQRAWTVWEAFAGFAQTWLEVEPENLIKAHYGDVISGVEEFKARRERFGVGAEEEQLAEIRSAFVEIWERHLGEVKGLSR